ncbi:hypothetical protein MRB53_027671 [Persea americana]|uniref:Uncharacterized protein n=1 Tax=Persea americana TaxID=3435 RepID=A0ACC2LLI5_PERAE|nr:hypothetical protein MRB53_027671 [Persea americana]
MAGISDLEEAEIELSLGLSIGGSYRKDPPVSISVPDQLLSDRSLAVDWTGSDGGGEANLADPQRRREIHARRRQEAMWKREEKKSLCRSGVSVNSHDRLVMEAQGLRCRAMDRTAREADKCGSDRRKSPEDPGETLGFTTPNQTLYPIQNPDPNVGWYQVPGFSVMPPMSVPACFPFHPMQCMPVPNGFHYPYLMPCPAPAPEEVSPASAGREGCLNSARRSFRPFSARSNNQNADGTGGGDDVEQIGGGVGGGVFNRSLGSSLSAVSDNGSAGSMQGGSNSSGSRSRSTRSPSQTQPLDSPLRNGQVQLEHSTSTQLKEYAQTVEEATEKVESNSAQSCPTKTEPTSGTTDQPASNDTAESGLSKPISTRRSASMSPLPHEVGGDPLEDKNQKPPSVSLPHMPCVSTTGNGPNGKTISGILSRYRKGEVSIVCACHGSSFTPAEFVKHAGGTDISHPLRHIVVVPSAFG